jgi:hypothetical protein
MIESGQSAEKENARNMRTSRWMIVGFVKVPDNSAAEKSQKEASLFI